MMTVKNVDLKPLEVKYRYAIVFKSRTGCEYIYKDFAKRELLDRHVKRSIVREIVEGNYRVVLLKITSTEVK